MQSQFTSLQVISPSFSSPSSFEDMDFRLMQKSICNLLRKKFPEKYRDLVPDDIGLWSPLLHTICVTFDNMSRSECGKSKLRPTFVSKKELCQILSPSSSMNRLNGTGGCGINPPLFEDLMTFSPRVKGYCYRQGNSLLPWTFYIAYDDIESAQKMQTYLHRESKAWYSEVRMSKHSEDVSYELKVWRLSLSLAETLVRTDISRANQIKTN